MYDVQSFHHGKRTIQTKSLKAQRYHDIHVHDEVMKTFDHNMNYVWYVCVTLNYLLQTGEKEIQCVN